MVAIAALLRIRYGFASPKNRPKTEKENALDRPRITRIKYNQEIRNSGKGLIVHLPLERPR